MTKEELIRESIEKAQGVSMLLSIHAHASPTAEATARRIRESNVRRRENRIECGVTMIMKIGKVLWVGAAFFVLVVTLYAYDGKPFSDAWIFLTWLMLILSFPAGLAISAMHYALGAVFSITIETSYLSLALEWVAYFFLGYLQWFKLVPYLVSRLRALRTQRSAANAKQ